MAFPVIVPRESEEMELCQIIQWHVRKGERVKQGDVLCEVDTGKATFDIEAPAEGMVLDIFFRENEEAPLLTPLAVIGEEGEVYEQFRPRAGKATTTAHGARSIDHEWKARSEQTCADERVEEGETAHLHSTLQRAYHDKTSEGMEAEVERPGGRNSVGRKPVSPRARRFALRNGIPLHRIQGSGPGGAVVERDVKEWIHRLHQ